MELQEQKTALFQALKTLLKQKKIQYDFLADHTGLTESSIKRIFSRKECTIDRLIEFCEAAGLTLTDLLEYMKSQEAEGYHFDAETERYFIRNIPCFVFYRKLFAVRDFQKVVAESKLPVKKARSFVKDLERLGLLERRVGDSIYFKKKGFLMVQKNPTLTKKYYPIWLPKFARKVMMGLGRKNHDYQLFNALMTQKTIQDFNQEFSELVSRYKIKSSLEQRVNSEELEPIAFGLFVGPYRMGIDDDIEISSS